MKKIVLTGASGNMGREVLRRIYSLPETSIRILVTTDKGEDAFCRSVRRRYAGVECLRGNIADEDICLRLAEGADYVINCAAVIPPRSDKYPDKAIECNYYGVKTLLDAIKKNAPTAKLIHISTVALYGNRTYRHPWGRVGDPLMPSVFDIYAKSKLFGERLVLESGLRYWAVLRQTAILHDRMLSDNISDGLMFHTCFNSPLEWVTAEDSGVLIKNIIAADAAGKADDFWKKVYNIGGGEQNRNTGYDTFNDGFGIIGGSAKSFMEPGWQADRNFHGVWFFDGEELEKKFCYQKQACSDYWRLIQQKNPLYRLGELLPPAIIKTLVIKRLLSDKNAPTRWLSDGEEAKVKASFADGKPTACDWSDFPLLREGHTPEGDIDFAALKQKSNAGRYLLEHGFDESKDTSLLDIEDIKRAAEFRGGRCLSEEMTTGDVYTPLVWECSEGHRFFASPYTVLFGGHWCEECLKEGWNYDTTAKKSPYFAQVYYDSHDRTEQNYYCFAGGKAVYREAN